MLRFKHLFVVFILLFSGYAGATSAELVVKEFIRAAAAGDVDNAKLLVYVPSQKPQDIQEIGEIVTILVQKTATLAQEREGFAAVTVTNITYIEEGTHARAEVRVYFGNGYTEQDSVRLVKTPKGWQVEI